MKPVLCLMAIAAVLMPRPILAEQNLVPSLDSTSDICPDRPEEPQWMQEIDVRDAYRRVLVQDIYRARSLTRIVEAGECSCQTRFPAWDTAEAEFLERFASAERWEMLDASEEYNRRANAARPEAMAVCEAEDNW